jgi:membrane protease YdiL (CAAX protease family)
MAPDAGAVDRPFSPRELLVAATCIVAGVAFFGSLNRLWPLADLDLTASRARVSAVARDLLSSRGFDLNGYLDASGLTVDTAVLDYIETSFGRAEAQRLIASGLPIVRYRVDLKRRGDPRWYSVDVHPEVGVTGWLQRIKDDDPGARLSVDDARELARDALRVGLRLDLASYEEFSAASTDRPGRRDHGFAYRRFVSREPELRERVTVTVAGDAVVAAYRSLVVPSVAGDAARAAQGPARALETLGYVLFAALVLAALFVFLIRLRDREVDLLRSLFWPGVVFLCLMGTYALETPSLFRAWEPLWPRWVSDFRYLSFRAFGGLALALLLLIVVGAGDALDRLGSRRRGASLWSLARGGLLTNAVALASLRGFLVGLLCGGAMTAAVVTLETLFGARTAIQPRGFFFYTLNTAAPALTSLLFFLGVALAEELGYRFFAGTWLRRLSGRPWLAIWLPAVVYGLTHTRLDFLPPADPWWGRALVLTMVGAVWGWAFFRYDALTVVLSHFTADLFIFNWPRLASDDSTTVVLSLVTVCVPLLPALLWAVTRWRPGPGRHVPREA